MSTTSPAETRAGCASRGYYDPTTGQFLTPDPLFTITGSRYGYAGNDPINGADPTGLFWGEGTLKNVTNTVVSGSTLGMANCVRGVTCAWHTKSVADTHPVLRDTLYVFAGAAATVASGGLALDGLGAVEAEGSALTLTSGLEGVASTGAGLFSASGDYGRCFQGHDELAGAGFWSGGAAAVLGLGGTFAPGVGGLMLAWLGFAPAGVGLGLDSYGVIRKALDRMSCH